MTSIAPSSNPIQDDMIQPSDHEQPPLLPIPSSTKSPTKKKNAKLISSLVYAGMAILFLSLAIVTGVKHERCGIFYVVLSSLLCAFASVWAYPAVNRPFLQPADHPILFPLMLSCWTLLFYAVATAVTFLVEGYAVFPGTVGVVSLFAIFFHGYVPRSSDSDQSGMKKKNDDLEAQRQDEDEEGQCSSSIEIKDVLGVAASVVLIVIIGAYTSYFMNFQAANIYSRWSVIPNQFLGLPAQGVASPSLPGICHNGEFRNLSALPKGVLLLPNGELAGVYREAGVFVVGFEISCLGGTFTLGVSTITFIIATKNDLPTPLCPLEDPSCPWSSSDSLRRTYGEQDFPLTGFTWVGITLLCCLAFAFAVYIHNSKESKKRIEELRTGENEESQPLLS